MAVATNAQDLANLLLLEQLAESYPDYPKNFIPPAYLDPNYVPPSEGFRVTIVCSVSMALALIVVGARLTARRVKVGDRVGADDWAIILATIVVMAFTGINISAVYYAGLGMHAYDCTFQELEYAILVHNFHSTRPHIPRLRQVANVP
jgi:hypothetical protein